MPRSLWNNIVFCLYLQVVLPVKYLPILNVNLRICIWYFALFSSLSVSCILHFLFHRDTHTEVHSAVCFIHPCIRSVHRLCIHCVYRLCITQSCILHSVYCTQGQRHAHSEAAISQTALQETWLNLPPPRLPSVSLMMMMMMVMILKLVIIAAMMMVVNDCWCHMVKYSISTRMIVDSDSWYWRQNYETLSQAVTFKGTIGPLPGEKVLWRLMIYCPQYLRNRREFDFLLCQLCSAWSLLLTLHNYESILIFVEQKQKLLADVTLISFWWHTRWRIYFTS